jgi:hypothetical protein
MPVQVSAHGPTPALEIEIHAKNLGWHAGSALCFDLGTWLVQPELELLLLGALGRSARCTTPLKCKNHMEIPCLNQDTKTPTLEPFFFTAIGCGYDMHWHFISSLQIFHVCNLANPCQKNM